MDSKTAREFLDEFAVQQGWKTEHLLGWSQASDFAEEFSDQQNAYLVEALDYALKTIMLQSGGKPIGDLDERISHFEQILKDHGK